MVIFRVKKRITNHALGEKIKLRFVLKKTINKLRNSIFVLLMPLMVQGVSDNPLRFGNLYSDHMVLQCEMPIRLSGYAHPGETVSGRFNNNPECAARTDHSGRWSLTLPPMPPGGPHTVTVHDGRGNAVTLRDVLIGEVWFCAGQSNMEYPVWGPHAYWRSFGGDTALREANYPLIRFVKMPRRTTLLHEETDIPEIVWEVCSPETIANFSAVGYYFGRTLHRERKVPVGLIGCYWSGTRITPWLSEPALRNSGPPLTQTLLDMLHENKGTALTRWPKSHRFMEWEKRFFENAKPDSRNRQHSPKNSDWNSAVVPPGSPLEEKLDGAVFYRRFIHLPAHWVVKELILYLGKIDDCDETWFNGVKVGETSSDVCAHWDVPRRYKIPGELVRAEKNILDVRVIDFAGGGGFTSPPQELHLICGTEKLPLAGTWNYRLDFVADPAVVGKRPDPISNRKEEMPAAIFNGMVAPWTGFPLRGIVWYQGESNATEPEEYAILFPLLIQSWRTHWNNPELAFVYAQLAPFSRHQATRRPAEEAGLKDVPGSGEGFTLLREVQAATLALPRTGMAVTLDVGDRFDIHPQRKQEVGFRLAKEAARICYGETAISSGPRFASMKITGDTAVLRFSRTGSGLSSRGTIPSGFVIAGADQVMYPAIAEILPPDQIVVRAPEVKNPILVRYGWEGCPSDANLFNREGFPMEPFRTDSPSTIMKIFEK